MTILINYTDNNLNYISPLSSLVLTPLATTTTQRPPSVLLPVQTISRPPSQVNPLLSTVTGISEVNGNFVDENQCGQQEISSGVLFAIKLTQIFQNR